MPVGQDASRLLVAIEPASPLFVLLANVQACGRCLEPLQDSIKICRAVGRHIVVVSQDGLHIRSHEHVCALGRLRSLNVVKT